jgi:hypothetical protein
VLLAQNLPIERPRKFAAFLIGKREKLPDLLIR